MGNFRQQTDHAGTGAPLSDCRFRLNGFLVCDPFNEILFYNRYRNSTATMVPVLPANAVYPAVFFVCGHLTGQARKRKAIENGAGVIIYSHGTLSAAGAYQ